MTGEQNWREDVTFVDYLGHQKKTLAVADRRPVIRKASDLVGPGIGVSAVRITNYNDVLATFNGYFSSAPGAANAPNATDTFVGFVTMDSEFGGWQSFRSFETGFQYDRMFSRSPLDASSILWGPWLSDKPLGWHTVGAPGEPPYESDFVAYGAPFQSVRFRRDGNEVRLDGLALTNLGSLGNVFTLPEGYRPDSVNLYSANGNSTRVSGAASTGTAHTHQITTNSQVIRIQISPSGVIETTSATPFASPSHLSLAGITFWTPDPMPLS